MSRFETTKDIEIIEIEPGEKNKNIETCVAIWEALTELQADRNCLLINLGGGVILDMGGFIAATFKRGIDFIFIPTTLLAMVDASIGGKTGIDLGVIKNQIGLFKTPISVLIHDIFLETLPANQMRSGLAEMLKHGLIENKKYWNLLKDLTQLTQENLLSLIIESVNIKKKFVQDDFKESGNRKKLNFGHTIGHAIESYFLALNQNPPVLHGEAVAAGMIVESYISYRKNLIDLDTYKEIKDTIDQYFEKLPLNEENIEAIFPYLKHDKKNSNNEIKFILLEEIGQSTIDQTCDDALILEGFKSYTN